MGQVKAKIDELGLKISVQQKQCYHCARKVMLYRHTGQQELVPSVFLRNYAEKKSS